MYKVILSIQNFNLEINEKLLFEELSLSVFNQDCIGLIGPNGSGKSSLLKVIAGSISSTNGNIQSLSSIYYLPQTNGEVLELNETLYEYISKRNSEWWNVQIMLEEEFGLRQNSLEQPINKFSGGEIIKINLSLALCSSAEVILLDEPTNHIDLKTKKKLEEIIRQRNKTFLIASHDTEFLDSICKVIWAVETPTIKVYGGNYSFYKEQKRLEEEAIQEKYEAKLKEIKKTKLAKEKEEKKAQMLSAKINRAFKSNDRSIPRMELRAMQDKGSRVSSGIKYKAQDALKTKQKELSELSLKRHSKINLLVKETDKSKRKLIDLENGRISIDNKEINRDLNLKVNYGDRILIKGDNGSGKTSLIKAIMHFLNPMDYEEYKLNGKIYISEKLEYEYLSQNYEMLKFNLSILENLRQYSPNLSTMELRKQLSHFLFFKDEEINKKVEVLSGGEMARLAMALITSRKLDLLILDEPTNNLDIFSKEQMVKGLREFKGAILIISHDEGFIKDVNLDKTLELINNYYG